VYEPIEALRWEFRDETIENPFQWGSTRPLRVTLHTSSIANPTTEEASAMALLRELAALDDIDLLETSSDSLDRIEIGLQPSVDHDYFDVGVIRNGTKGLSTYIPYPNQKLTAAKAPPLSDAPPEDDVFGVEIRQRLALLA
jgi:hypothetical protein